MIISLSMWPPRRRPNTTGSRTVPTSFLTDAQWARIRDLFENHPSPKGGRRRRNASKAFFGFCVGLPWKHRERFPSPAMLAATPRLDRSRAHRRSMNPGDGSTGHRRWGMAPFRLRSWQDQEGQGHQADVDDGRKGNSRLRTRPLPRSLKTPSDAGGRDDPRQTPGPLAKALMQTELRSTCAASNRSRRTVEVGRSNRAGRTLPPTVQASNRANIQLARQPDAFWFERILCSSLRRLRPLHACYYVSSSLETASSVNRQASCTNPSKWKRSRSGRAFPQSEIEEPT